ncbi:AAA family ATPase [Rhodococcus hoagii]|nr:AAA family ATPase [Prescottella equi]
MTEPSPLKLIQANVFGVLDAYDHHIDFDAEEDYIIVYGPNGVGKTKTLEVIHALCRVDGRTLSNLPFVKAEIEFTDKYRIVAEVVEPDASSELIFSLYAGRQPIVEWKYEEAAGANWLIENTSWRPLENGLWQDRRDGEVLTYSELEGVYAADIAEFPDSEIPSELAEFKERIPVHLIETQRLRAAAADNFRIRRNQPLRRRSNSPTPSRITAQADLMKTFINRAQTSHSRITQQLDRTFPNRVLETSFEGAEVNDGDIRDKYNHQNEFRSRLGRVVSVPLDSEFSLPDRSLESWELRLLDLYLSDADKKLEPFGYLLRRIELLEDILNRRLLRKRVQANATDGIAVFDDLRGREIPLDALSSGEQHEVILMFDLLFTVPEGALVLIDEPEISLHVGWQLAFMPDIQQIARLRDLRFIIATHSPQIINGEWDKALRLGPSDAEF